MILDPRLVALVSAVFISGCASPIRPDELQTPPELTCISLKDSLAVTGLYGPFDVQWTTKLERGPYWSEKTDDMGTYYRAPPGGLSVRGKEGTAFPGQPASLDGGFYVPNNPKDPVRLYAYFSIEAAPAQVSPSDADCSTVGFVKHPSTSGVSLVWFAVGGAVGGAAGGIIGRSMVEGAKMSYGQAAGAGAAGGLIGGLIIASIINSGVGKIVPVQPPIKDVHFLEKLRSLAATKVSVPEVQVPLAAGEAQSAAPIATSNRVRQ